MSIKISQLPTALALDNTVIVPVVASVGGLPVSKKTTLSAITTFVSNSVVTTGVPYGTSLEPTPLAEIVLAQSLIS